MRSAFSKKRQVTVMEAEPTKQEVRLSPRFLAWLRQEIDDWERAGVVEGAVAETLRSRYMPAETGINRLIGFVSLFGAILVGVGLILLMAANWEELPRAYRVSLIFGVVLSAYGGGYYLRYERGASPRVGEGLLFLGALAYGAGIWLIAQMYHLPADYYTGALLWALGVLPTAWVLKSPRLLALASLLLTLWMTWGAAVTQQANCWYLVLMLGVIWPLCYRLASRECLATGLLGLTVFVGLALFKWTGERPDLIALLYVPFGALVYAVGLAHASVERLGRYGLVYRGYGTVAILAATYFASFRWLWEVSHYGVAKEPHAAALIALLVVVGLGLAVAHLWQRSRASDESGTSTWEIVGLGGLCGLTVALFLIGLTVTVERAGYPWGSPRPADPWVLLMTILCNVLLVAEIIGVVWVALRNRQRGLLNVGVVFFALQVVTRYFDFGWQLLDRSLFFIVGGLLLLGGGWLLERQRRHLLHDMEVK